MPKPTTLIWTPQGLVDLAGKKPANMHRVELPPKLMEWFRQGFDFFTHFQIALVCRKCDGVFIGKNADTDKVFITTCGCREFIGANRDYREPTSAEAFYEAVVDYDPTKVS